MKGQPNGNVTGSQSRKGDGFSHLYFRRHKRAVRDAGVFTKFILQEKHAQ